ncbi:alanine racemase [Mesorhizobium sp. M1060]|uniref:alanine racemase n=1 Tax=unclassified Mesorhizobium TaxID=325217 RepID=UPI0003D0609E|nr:MULTISPECIES: alanine racemase [unclassified Mesorhizobium]ESZ08239.1 alanine racemase [Mesorhizobium sp. L2C089B000]WJI53520.1 alanine racemase [Mesorhizobium sp. C089B]
MSLTDTYFAEMSGALRAAGIFQPCLVLDLDRLDHNIAAIKAKFATGLDLRLVDKSLPCLPLIDHIRAAFATDRLMTFHLPISAEMLKVFPQVDLLLGKPMPVAGARHALTKGVLAGLGEATSRIVWLIDAEERLAAYGSLAAELDRELRVCFEVDVGLHRGGISDPDSLARAVSALANYPRLKCEGVMAYEAHIGHIPKLLGGPAKARVKAISLFRQYVACLAADRRKILNLGGSSTALLYDSWVGANELSIGSAFMLPTDFDVPSLSQLRPAAFIATPILKVVDVQAPGLDQRSWLLQKLGLLPRRGCFLYGGKWMAKPVHPVGMKTDKTFGFSTNQQFMALPDDASVGPDDYAFLRPTQSEFVLQQFGSIQVYSGGKIAAQWATLPFS